MTVAEDTYQTLFLERGLNFYNELDVPAAMTAPNDSAPYSALIVRLSEIGSRNATIDLEISFVPGLSEAANDGVYLLQTFAVLKQSASNMDANNGEIEALLRKIAEINTTLPIGAFGLFPDSGTLYYKHNAMLHRDSLTRDDCAARLDRQNGLVLHQLQLYLDHLA